MSSAALVVLELADVVDVVGVPVMSTPSGGCTVCVWMVDGEMMSSAAI
jgi:hypothetical protein